MSATNSLGTVTKSINIAAYFTSGGTMGQSVCWWDANGFFKCWGYNGAGGLGDGTNTSRNTAQITTPAVTQGANAVVQYAQSNYGSTCLLTSAGAVYCSGYNGSYELGIGTSGNTNSFVLASGMTSGYTSIASLPFGYCALNASGSLYCWGFPGNTLFTSGSSSSASTPVLSNLTTNVARISGGNMSICALSATYNISCWGELLTYGGPGNVIVNWGSAATAVSGASSPISLTSSGDTYCVINLAGTISCMGENYFGQMGNSTSATTYGGFTSAMLGVSNASQVACAGISGDNPNSSRGPGVCCVLLGTGVVQCAGSGGTYAVLGSYYLPVTVAGLSNVVALQSFGSPFASGNTTNTAGFCAILQSGSMTCWGSMYSGFETFTLTPIAGIP
jgi:hypothetical protein